MNDRRLRIYVGLICLGAVVGAALADWSALSALPRSGIMGLAGLAAIGVLSEGLAIGVAVGTTAHTSSITFLPLLAGVQLFGPAAAILFIATTQVFGEFVVRRKGLLKGGFNIAQAVLATSVAGWAFGVLGGVPVEGVENPDLTGQIFPFLSFGLLFLALNHAAVSLAITISQGQSFRRIWRRALDNTAGLNDILISPIALAIAFLYVSFGIVGIVVVLLPMLFIRYSYITTSKLRESNSDLLTALVKAIEIRDPYTSGHSVRVSRLAERIAENLGLKEITVARVTNAALLHDIGKIEAIYTEILRKPDSLTPHERAVIESHVTRGEQLLRDLSSVPEEVVKMVRHHHEREDGQGYPDGLVGDEIPIGSKVIIVCDAVDAMLSDRPYRDALPLSVVLEQLHEHAGRQFDHRVIKALVQTDILAEYAETMRISRQEQAAERSVDIVPHVPSMQQAPTRAAASGAGRYH
jgi:putative nucleotidyltransferase with HDIG domain